MKQLKIVVLGMLSFLICHAIALAAPTAKVTGQIIDESGTPIEKAVVRVAYQVTREKGKIGLKGVTITGNSDKDGLFSASHEDGVPQVTISARKDGYYRSSKIVKFTSESRFPSRWEPWNPTVEIILKKRRNPVAMYAKSTGWLKIPRLNTPIGYDLEKGDWVSPYGQGITSDLEIKCDYEKRTYTDYKTNIIINLPNKKDGIQEFYFNEQDESSYAWPFEAPEKGYIKSIHLYEESTPDSHATNKKKNVNYIFRIRTKLDDEGNIIEAKYGKIENEFGVSGDSTKIIYWLNPSGTRNLEFDPKQNLMKWSSRRDEQKHRIKSP